MSRHHHSSRNEKSHPHSHSRRDTRHETRHEKKKVTSKNLAATLGMMGLAIGATLLMEGGPWKSRMAAAATVVGMEQMLESGGFFDGKGEGDGRVVREEEYRRERGGRGERVERERREGRGLEEDRRRRDVEDDDERAYRHRRERVREEEDRRETRGTRHGHGHGHNSYERTRRDSHDEDDQRRRERRARREANRRFDEQSVLGGIHHGIKLLRKEWTELLGHA
ncbi:hypothetical protein BCON_0022g00530 [Botryotinia convoluta]|uniref:Uncharacterized protein n=1 Tax=Botryotinia convoluta TaxID=54673 RepID=A0A4Z1IKG4_9HELO|nr:hypothetical protein BCON_0022g00530 [Botryotinia convoluta]